MIESKALRRAFLPVVILFALIGGCLLALRCWLGSPDSGATVLQMGNGMLFLATGLSFYLYSKALRNNNVQVFLRMLYSSLLVKMFICLSGALVYFYVAGKAVSKTGVFGSFGLYILYTFVEVKVLMRLSKQQKNA